MEQKNCTLCKKDFEKSKFITKRLQESTICINCRKKHHPNCEHKNEKYYCKVCNDPIKLTIKYMVSNSKNSDKKYNRYDPINTIDKPFVQGLINQSSKCHYCKIQMQFIKFNDTLATIERLNNQYGHNKDNCVLACKSCNLSKVGNIIQA